MDKKTEIGNRGEEAVRDILKTLQGSLIAGFIRSKNICYYGRNFQIDFLVFVPKIGLVIVEVKNWRGTIKATSKDQWTQEFKNNTHEYGNASLQALRTAGMLLQILEKGGLNKYPIRPVVVFAHDDATILRANKAHLAPQTDIIRKSMLENWLQENSSSEINYRFSQNDFDAVKNIIIQYTQEYVAKEM